MISADAIAICRGPTRCLQASVELVDDHLSIELQLPLMLAAFAERVRAVVQQNAPALLGPGAKRD